MSLEREPAGGDPFAFDGGIEAELERRGVRLREHPGAAPLPVREPAAVRRAHLDIVVAGAAVVTAATGGLHRRALSRLGDSRRAREWSLAAIALARDAASEAVDRGCSGGLDRDGGPRPIRVAGLVLPLEGRALAALSVDSTAAAREHRAHAAILAEGGVDIARADGMGTVAEAEAAARAAAEEGLDCWSGIVLAPGGRCLPSGEPLEAWVSAVLPYHPAALLVSGATMADVREAVRWCVEHVDIPVGADLPSDAEDDVAPRADQGAADEGETRGADDLRRAPDDLRRAPDDLRRAPDDETRAADAANPDEGQEAEPVDSSRKPLAAATLRLIEDGASLVGPGLDGSPRLVRAIRRATDQFSRGSAAARAAILDGWRAWLAEGTVRAGGGRGLWLADSGLVVPLPAGFAWDSIAADDLRSLPSGRYRLAAAILPHEDVAVALARLIHAVEAGGWVLVASPSESLPGALSADGRLEWLAPTDSRPPAGYAGWIGRRRS